MSGQGVSERLNDPYLQGQQRGSGPTPSPGFLDPSILPVMIDGRGYLVDTSRNTNVQERFRRSSVQLLNSQQNIDKGESALTTPEVWRRTYQSWHHGMGQSQADRTDSDPFRYDWSKGINPWVRWQLELLHDVEKVVLPAEKYVSGLLVNGFTVALLGSKLSVRVTDGTTSATFTLPSGPANIATDGYHLYAIGTDKKLHFYTISKTGAVISVTEQAPTGGIATGIVGDINLLVLANYKLVACTVKGEVYDITGFIGATTAPTLPAPCYKSPVPGETFVSGCSGKQAIYMMSNLGDKATVHAFSIDKGATGTVDLLKDAGVVAELPDGEKGYAIYSYLGYVALGTSKGFRFSASGGANAALTYGPLIETPHPVACFEGQDRFLYFGLTGFMGDSGVGRADLSQFVADLQPAYASDLLVPAEGVQQTVFINTMPDGKLLFGLSEGLWHESDLYVTEGSIVCSRWTFNVSDKKIGMYATVQVESGTGSGSGSLYALYDNDLIPVFLGDSTPGGAQQRFPLFHEPFYSVAMKGVLIAPQPGRTVSPRISSIELRATYVRGTASEWQVPCILHDVVEQDNGAFQARDVIGDFQHLLGLVQGGQQFAYREEGQRWTVYATDFIWSPQERSTDTGWQGVFTIYFREVK